jgi:hypothetical protein
MVHWLIFLGSAGRAVGLTARCVGAAPIPEPGQPPVARRVGRSAIINAGLPSGARGNVSGAPTLGIASCLELVSF